MASGEGAAFREPSLPSLDPEQLPDWPGHAEPRGHQVFACYCVLHIVHLPPSPSRSLAAWHSSGQGGPIDQMSARGGTGKVQAAARRVSARLSLPCPALWLEPARLCRTFLAWRRRRNVWRKPLAGAAAADYSSWHSRPQPASHHPPPLKSRNNNHHSA